MNSEKIFWAMIIVIAAGFFAFMAFGVMAAPLNAAQGSTQVQLQSDNAKAAQFQEISVSSGKIASVENGVQVVQLTVQGGNYMPNPIRVKKGVPVKITADLSSVQGCASTIVIPEFGIRKTVRSGDNTIEFTPGKSGTFSFSCSMGMYRGEIVVEEADGTVASFTGSTKPVATGSCGGAGGSGGCGCGAAAPKAATPSKGGCGCGGA